ncbi:CPBP family intramembrane glutamic endopeptidase [Streptomyces sp. NPDC050315]|uniref:CPBP family intramembrane glutamic endopeptidase n=1 Tax=Streptomyces sp. NPDC050315 TaxID=3155039 RepID=UPI00343E336C
MASAAALFAVVAVIRLAGAFTAALMALSVVLSAVVLLVVPRSDWAVGAGLRRFAARPAAVGAALVAMAYAVALLGTSAAFGRGKDNWVVWIPELFKGLLPGPRCLGLVAMLLAMGAIVPLAEEICYRGVLYTALERRMGTNAAILLTAAAWALVHLGDYGLNPFNVRVMYGALSSVFLMGLALGICRSLTGSTLACAATQGMCNMLLLGAVGCL